MAPPSAITASMAVRYFSSLRGRMTFDQSDMRTKMCHQQAVMTKTGSRIN